jgi:hypothetical protein
MYIPEISASKVAGLIGLHKYQDAYEVTYGLLCKDKLIKARIADIEKATNRRPFSVVANDILKEQSIRDCVNRGIRACKATNDIPGVLKDVEGQARLALSLRHSFTPDVREQLVQEIRSKVSTQRGLQNENHILDAYETERDVKVTERNTKTIRKDYGKFKLVGRTDGYVESEKRIVDSKDRTRFWPEVPLYDEIQLRCYMDMTGATESELIERFPNGQTRHTKFLNDPEKWKTLQDAIEKAVIDMNSALRDNELLKRIVFQNTVCIAENASAAARGSSEGVSRAEGFDL